MAKEVNKLKGDLEKLRVNFPDAPAINSLKFISEKAISNEINVLLETELTFFCDFCYKSATNNQNMDLANQTTNFQSDCYEILGLKPRSECEDCVLLEHLISAYLRISNNYINLRKIGKAAKFLEVLYKLTAGNTLLEIRWKVINSYARYYSFSSNFDKAFLLHEEALNTARTLGDDFSIKKSMLNIAGALVDKYDYGAAAEYFNDLLKMLSPQKTEDEVIYVAVFNNIGEMYLRQGMLDNALAFYEKKISMLHKTNDLVRLSAGYSDIGTIYEKKGYLNKAKNFYLKDLTMSEKIKSEYGVARAFANLGNVSYLQNNYDKAEDFYLQSCQKAKELENNMLYHNVIISLSNTAVKKGMYDKALGYLLREADYCSYRRLYNELIQVNLSIIDIYKDNERYEETSVIVAKTWHLAKKINNNDAIFILLFIKSDLALYEQNYKLASMFIKQIADNLKFHPDKKHTALMNFYKAKIFFKLEDYTSALEFATLAEQQAINIGLEDLVFEIRLLSSLIRAKKCLEEKNLLTEKEYLHKLMQNHSQEQSADIYYNLLKIESMLNKLHDQNTSPDYQLFTQNCLKVYSNIVKVAPTIKVRKRLRELNPSNNPE